MVLYGVCILGMWPCRRSFWVSMKEPLVSVMEAVKKVRRLSNFVLVVSMLSLGLKIFI